MKIVIYTGKYWQLKSDWLFAAILMNEPIGTSGNKSTKFKICILSGSWDIVAPPINEIWRNVVCTQRIL